jgi:hypothetical protein
MGRVCYSPAIQGEPMILFLILACSPTPKTATCTLEVRHDYTRLTAVVLDMGDSPIMPTPELEIGGNCPKTINKWEICETKWATVRVRGTQVYGECSVENSTEPLPNPVGPLPGASETSNGVIRMYDIQTKATCYLGDKGMWCFCPAFGCDVVPGTALF